MAVQTHSNPRNPKNFISTFKLLLYALALIGLIWLGLQAYWGFFKFKIWFAGFGTGAFFVLGLIAGFIYYQAVHRIHERVREMPAGVKKALAYAVLSAGLIVANPLPLSLVLWIFTPPGDLNSAGEWFLIGCAIATVTVLLLERLFAKKAPQA